MALFEIADRHGRRCITHDWSRDAADCRRIQDALAAERIDHDRLPSPIRRLGGIDIGFEAGGAITRAAAVVLDPETLEIIESALARVPTRMPYIPGLLSFREVPAAIRALEALTEPPDLIMVDGHGIAHPRRLGVATHLGLVTGLSSIGVAKKRLTGTHEAVDADRGTHTPLRDGREIIGTVLRSRSRVKPIFISPGHRIGHDSALRWVTRALTRYRLPETTRMADKIASNR